MQLKGNKVILRPIKMGDASRFVKWLKDPEVNKFITRKPATIKDEKQWIKNLVKLKKIEHHFAVETNEGIHIGSASLFLNLKDKNAKFGILIGDKNYWDKGYGTDITKTILNYGFTKLKLHRIQLRVYEYNSRAINVYQKLGFKLEGIKREDVLYKGKFYNHLLMGILKNEWIKLNKK